MSEKQHEKTTEEDRLRLIRNFATYFLTHGSFELDDVYTIGALKRNKEKVPVLFLRTKQQNGRPLFESIEPHHLSHLKKLVVERRRILMEKLGEYKKNGTLAILTALKETQAKVEELNRTLQRAKDSELLITQHTWNNPETIDLWRLHQARNETQKYTAELHRAKTYISTLEAVRQIADADSALALLVKGTKAVKYLLNKLKSIE